MSIIALKIYGMDCVEEVTVLKKEFSNVKGINSLDFDVLNGKMTISFDDKLIDQQTLIEIAKKTGMKAEIYDDSSRNEDNESIWRKWNKTFFTSCSGIFLLAGFLVHGSMSGFGNAISESEGNIPLLAKIFYLLATILGVWFVLPKAWHSLKRFLPDMNLLMVIAVSGAIGIGEWFEAGTVSFLFALSLALESFSISRARKAISALMEISPLKARIVGSDGKEQEIAVEKVEIGIKILVKPGEKIPLDGKIVSGSSSLNQAPITGESVSVSKTVGDEVYAGSINEDGAIEIEITKLASESTLSRIIKLVEDAQSKKSVSEQWVEKFARYYTPIIMVFAILVTLLLPLIFNYTWSKSFYEALVLLVIACPCALVISTPVSIISALVSAAKNGILIKGGVYVELPAKLKVIAMDKTGTITQGSPQVDQVVPLSGHTKEELLSIATAIEKMSEHPLAQAIVGYAHSQNINPIPVENYQAIKGKGATATLNGKSAWIGSQRYLEESGKQTDEMRIILEKLTLEGRSIVVVGEHDHVCGFISLVDKIRDDAKDTILKLKTSGIEKVIMLTGDNQQTADSIAKMANVDEVKANLLPENKVSVIEQLVNEYEFVAMIGDGVNDAPALARSSLGIAMGMGGTDAALETADIILMKDDLSKIPWLILHSHRTINIIKQNIFISIGIKLLFVALTLSGHASLWAAIAADMGVSLFVVTNALRLLRSENY